MAKEVGKLKEKRLKEREERRIAKAAILAKKKTKYPKMEDIFRATPKSKQKKTTQSFKVDSDVWDILKMFKKYGMIKSLSAFLIDQLLIGISGIKAKLKENNYDFDILMEMYADKAKLNDYADYLDKEDE